MSDDLGDRMKSHYEDRTRYFLPRRTYTIIRVDGKAFHTYTRKAKRPYDLELMSAMDAAALWLCDELQGSQFAYTQSDEISILLTDFTKPTTSAWFDGNLQKMVSVAASIATAAFNDYVAEKVPEFASPYNGPATFDARAFTIPDPVEVENYFIWRQKDATRNSISMAAQSLYSHTELHGKGDSAKLDMILAKGQNWNHYPWQFKRGRVTTYKIDDACGTCPRWYTPEVPIFTQDRTFLSKMIPRVWADQPATV